MIDFPKNAEAALDNAQLRSNIKMATHAIRAKRAEVVGEKSDWEELRRRGERIKNDVLANLDGYLLRLEEKVTEAGGTVHWATDGERANEIIASIVKSHNQNRVVKVKSLTTDEIELNDYLLSQQIEPIETDLAEMIVQLAGDKPSHILVPAIHKNRDEIKDLFEKNIVGGEIVDSEPTRLAEIARIHLRQKFLDAQVSVSGANFAVAETGTVCVVESEGNGRMCLTLPKVLITVMGIEKVVPSLADLGVLMELLPRSSTGERMNPYTSLWTGVHREDGPREFHLIILDNGRSKVLEDSIGYQALRCIRCSACLNVCPVYERTGGHAYGSVYPGPIGAILSPQLFDTETYSSLPFASTLCGACYEVCPVRIDIPRVLVHLRERSQSSRSASPMEKMSFRAMLWVFSSQRRFGASLNLLGLSGRWLNHMDKISFPKPIGAWTMSRKLPVIPGKNFRGKKMSRNGG